MSSTPSNPFGSPFGLPVGRGSQNIVPGQDIVPGNAGGFQIPTETTPASPGADETSAATPAPLVGTQTAHGAAATEDSQAGPTTQTLGQEYDKLSEGRRQNYASLYNSYFG